MYPEVMDQRLRPIERLGNSGEYERVFKRGRSFYTPCLRIHSLPNAREHSRLGLVVTRRLGKAVLRNLVKRRLREVFRKNKDRLPRPMDLVFVAQGGPRLLEEYLSAFLKFAEKLK